MNNKNTTYHTYQDLCSELEKENQELKKQLKEYQHTVTKYDTQQKKFIEYLENEIKERNIQIAGYHPTTQLLIEQIIETEKKVLSKYKEKIEYLKKQKENKNKWFQLIADIGFDYDGYNDVENLKQLIDELVKFALNGRDNYEYENIFEELESSDSND